LYSGVCYFLHSSALLNDVWQRMSLHSVYNPLLQIFLVQCQRLLYLLENVLFSSFCEICTKDADSQVYTLRAITTLDQNLTFSVCRHRDHNFTSQTEDGLNQGSNPVGPVRAGTYPFGQSNQVISRTTYTHT